MSSPGEGNSEHVLPIGGGYRLVSRIGYGGFGEVWRAEAPGGVEVAIKMLFRSIDHEEAKRELQSLELIKGLRHPFLLQTQAYWSLQDRLFILMELADGSLRDRLRECVQAGLPGIPEAELVTYMKESAEALDFLHQKQVLHRDIKPENILLLQRHAKLADFGLAKLQQSQRLVSVTGSGTPAYMAPEMWGNKVSEHSDQYCLAVTYAELRLQRRLFASQNLAHLMMEHLTKTPDLAPLGEAEQQVLLRALAKDPEQRYPRCLAFAEALAEAVTPSRRPSWPEVEVSPGVPARQPTPRPLTPKQVTPADANLGTVRTLDPALALTKTMQPPALPAKPPPGWHTPPPLPDAEVPPPTAWVRRLCWAVVLLVLVGVPLVLIGQHLIPSTGNGGKEEPSVRLERVPPVHVQAGRAERLTLRIRRNRCTDPVQLFFDGVPARVSLPDTRIPEKADYVQLVVSAELNAAPGKHTVTVHARAGELRHKDSFTLEVGEAKYFWRAEAGWERPPEARLVTDVDDVNYYDQIDVVRGDVWVRFVLVRRQRAEDPTTFYIMQDKVSVQQFRRFATDRPEDVKNGGWKQKGLAGKDYPRDQQPVMGVAVLDAHRFAVWLGGRLPSRNQWDKAAGRKEPNPREGPFEGAWAEQAKGRIAINRTKEEGPMHCGQAAQDKSPLGCHDMSGNGWEWTRDLALGRGTVEKLLGKDPDTSLFVHLRGQSWAAKKPLLFKDLKKNEDDETEETRLWQTTANTIGFRVVIERR
jgi:serine/threonine protein kinase